MSKQPRCIVCAQPFTAVRFLQRTCGYKCGVAHSKQLQDEAKARNLEKRPIKTVKFNSCTKSHADHLNGLQIVFNRYIRERDKDKPCISCGCEWNKYFQAGHFFSVGGNPAVRFDEDNCHGQCYECNIDKGGNQDEYAKRLMIMIPLSELNYKRCEPLKLSIPEILDLINEFKEKTKVLKQLNTN